MVTIMSTEGKPIQVPASSLQMAGVQNSNGKYNKQNNCQRTQECSTILNNSRTFFYRIKLILY